MAAARKKLAAKHKSLRRQAPTLRRAASEPIWKTLKKTSATRRLIWPRSWSQELLDLAHRRIVARKVYQLAHLIWNVPYIGGGIKLETMLKNLHDLTQIFYSEMMATQAKASSSAFAPQNVMSALPSKADMCGGDVRFGPKADICTAPAHVRFTPESDIKCDIWNVR